MGDADAGTETGYQDYELYGRDGSPHRFLGLSLGWDSSDDGKRDRWYEVALYRLTKGDYLVYTCGGTRVPGETDRRRIVVTSSPYEVIELLTTRSKASGELFLPRPAQLTLAQAAALDDGIRDAYVNRAVGTS